MSKGESKILKWLIVVMLVILGVCMPFTMDATITSGLMVILDLLLLGIIFALIGFHGYQSGCGRFATESNLDENLYYEIREVVKLRFNKTLFVLKESEKYKTEVVLFPSGGFKKFDVLEEKFIVPKSMGATVVNGRLFVPSR